MQSKNWTIAEEEYLKNNYHRFTNKELATILKRSYWAIKSKAKELHLKKQKAPPFKVEMNASACNTFCFFGVPKMHLGKVAQAPSFRMG